VVLTVPDNEVDSNDLQKKKKQQVEMTPDELKNIPQ
jgi:hypothetical protein